MRTRLLTMGVVAMMAATPATASQSYWHRVYHQVVMTCKSPTWCGWQTTVDCENYGLWYDTPGSFTLGLQFEYGTLMSAQRATGILATPYPPTQIVNAKWRLRQGGDPWPNCPNPWS